MSSCRPLADADDRSAREDRTQRLEERILQAHQRAEEPLSLRDATRNWRGVDRKDVVAAYETLVATGELVELPTGRTTRYAPPGVGGPEGSG